MHREARHLMRTNRGISFQGAAFATFLVACSAGPVSIGYHDASSDDDVIVIDDVQDAGVDGFPQCSGAQRCVGSPSFGDWVCLESCSGVDAGDCPSGMTCTSVSGCCTGMGCSATSANVCVAQDAGASGDAASDASGDAASDAPSDGTAGNADSGFPQCSGTQRCVGSPSFGDWVCLESCSGVDAGGCPSGMTCTSVSGCCTGTGCSATSANVCVTP